MRCWWNSQSTPCVSLVYNNKKRCWARVSVNTRNTFVLVLSQYQACMTAVLITATILACNWPSSLLKRSHLKLTLQFMQGLWLLFTFVDWAQSVYGRQREQKMQGSHWPHEWYRLKSTKTQPYGNGMEQVTISNAAKVWAGVAQRIRRMQKWTYSRVFFPHTIPHWLKNYFPEAGYKDALTHTQNFSSLDSSFPNSSSNIV